MGWIWIMMISIEGRWCTCLTDLIGKEKCGRLLGRGFLRRRALGRGRNLNGLKHLQGLLRRIWEVRPFLFR